LATILVPIFPTKLLQTSEPTQAPGLRGFFSENPRAFLILSRLPQVASTSKSSRARQIKVSALQFRSLGPKNSESKSTWGTPISDLCKLQSTD